MIDLEIINYPEDQTKGNKVININNDGQISLFGLNQDNIHQFNETIKHLSKELTRLKNLSKKQFDELSL